MARILIGVPAIALLGAISPWFWLLYVVGAALYLKRPYQRLIPIAAQLKPIGPAQGDRVGAHHPRGGRHRQDDRLSGRRPCGGIQHKPKV